MELPKNTIITPVFRTMFPALFTPVQMKDQPNSTPKYKVEALFDEYADLTDLKALASKVAREKWGDRLPAKLKYPFRSGDERTLEDGVTPRPEYTGKVFCIFSSGYQVAVVDRNKIPITDETLVYPGVKGRAIVKCNWYNTAGNIGVTFYLQLYQLVGGGERVIPQMDQYLPDDLPAEESEDNWGSINNDMSF